MFLFRTRQPTRTTIPLAYQSEMTYIIDYFNIFSDFREVYYKNMNVDFHNVKHENLSADTIRFFKVFFSIYVKKADLDTSRQFVFIIKKLYNYRDILESLIQEYSTHFNLRFMIVKDRYKNKQIDKNKDDFICQYMLGLYGSDAEIVTNDKYSDSKQYIQTFLEEKQINVQSVMYMNGYLSIKECPFLITEKTISKILLQHKANKKSIPKANLGNLIVGIDNVGHDKKCVQDGI